MGEYADIAIEEEINRMMECPIEGNGYSVGPVRKSKKKKPFTWMDATGKVWKPEDMTTSHIKNSIKKCERENRGVQAISFFNKELKKREKYMKII